MTGRSSFGDGRDPRSPPSRTCVGCGARAPASALVRLVLDGGTVVRGTAGRGGRGAWLHADEACLTRAVRRKAFARAFRGPATAEVEALRPLLTASARKN
ncbi:MAG TPA: YlxR family protein [Anaeromyxobacteraceae bacterium]|nr:YlxR family protein [Anaeromyxobacteraceae bacterium]